MCIIDYSSARMFKSIVLLLALATSLGCYRPGLCQPPESTTAGEDDLNSSWISISRGVVKNFSPEQKAIIVEHGEKVTRVKLHSDCVPWRVEENLTVRDLKVGDLVGVGKTDETGLTGERGHFMVTEKDDLSLTLEAGNFQRGSNHRYITSLPYFQPTEKKTQEKVGRLMLYDAARFVNGRKDEEYKLYARLFLTKPHLCTFTRYTALSLDNLKDGDIVSGRGIPQNGEWEIFNLNVLGLR